jgi:7-carboxy-7-deazaguanine synthase
VVAAPATTARSQELRLRITEIFRSIQGESTLVGLPTTFVRLTGCPLRCGYCDTAYAFQGGDWKSGSDILQTVDGLGVQHVCVTGGEPLAQKQAPQLLQMLCDAGYTVSLETSGALPINVIDRRVMVVMDVKTPSSGESHRNLAANRNELKHGDQVKFVVGDRVDFEWGLAWLGEQALSNGVEVLWSPVWNTLPLADLAAWVSTPGVPGRMQIQLHKVIWGEEPGR